MSGSEILLDVSAADQSSEVMVIDSDFRVLGRGIRHIQLAVAPGIYRAKARVGTLQSEQLFAVEADEPGRRKAIELPPLEFSSPIPLQQTSSTREFHQSAIQHAAASKHAAQLGQGAAVIVFLRDPSLVYFDLMPEQKPIYAEIFSGFALSQPDGSEAHPLESIGTLDADHGYLIASADVEPGAYALSRPAPGNERLCMPLFIPAGWQLQVFVTMTPVDEGSVARQADFDGAAMVLDRIGTGFHAERPDLRLLEVVRQGLARGHNVVDARSMDSLLAGTLDNPMLGLLAAHLLLLAKQVDLELVEKIVASTERLIEDGHPDLTVLAWKLRQLRGTLGAPPDPALEERLKAPPMLQLSWQYMMEACRGHSDAGTFGECFPRIVGQRVNSSVWAAWMARHDSESEDQAPAASAAPEEAPCIAVEAEASRPVARARGLINSAIDHARSIVRDQPILLASLAIDAAYSAPSLDIDWREHISRKLAEKKRAIKSARPHKYDAHTTARVFRTLVERVDWRKVIALLKNAEPRAEDAPSLTPLQRQLLMVLKAAREEFEDEGSLSEESVQRRLKTIDVPLKAILDNLEHFFLIAKHQDEAHQRQLELSRASASQFGDNSLFP